jgi:sulfate transport system ATP-binding protein
MNKGRVEQVGSAQDVYERPATAFAYSFLGAVNRFTGRIDGTRLRVGDGLVPISEGNARNGEEVVAYARPHELDILDGDGPDGIPVRVGRVLLSGATARVELTGKIGTNGHAEPQLFEVEMTRQRLSDLNLQPGQPVRLTSERLKVFPITREG